MPGVGDLFSCEKGPLMFTSFTLFPTPSPCIEFVTVEGDLKFIEPHPYIHCHLPPFPLRIQLKQLDSKILLLYLVKNHRPVAPPMVLRTPLTNTMIISKLQEAAERYRRFYTTDPDKIHNIPNLGDHCHVS